MLAITAPAEKVYSQSGLILTLNSAKMKKNNVMNDFVEVLKYTVSLVLTLNIKLMSFLEMKAQSLVSASNLESCPC